MQAPPVAEVAQAAQFAQQVAIFGIRLEGWFTIIAVLAGPVLAVQAQKWVERRREQRARKLFIFRELMATRAARLSQRHVEALNLIDLEYDQSKRQDKPVQEAWRSYLDALSIPNDEKQQQLIFDKRKTAFIELMYQMSKHLGYSFDRVAIERNVYSPVWHGKLEDDQELIRRGIVDLLTGKRALSTVSWLMPGKVPLQVTEVPPEAMPANAVVEQPQPRQALEDGRPRG